MSVAFAHDVHSAIDFASRDKGREFGGDDIDLEQSALGEMLWMIECFTVVRRL